MRVLFDTAVFIYAVGSEHRYRHSCRRLVELLAGERIVADVSGELIEEYAHIRSQRGIGRSQVVDEARSIVALCRVHDVQMSQLQIALQLFRTHDQLHMREALHAATALACHATVIVSPDPAFDDIPGLERIDPTDAPDRLVA